MSGGGGSTTVQKADPWSGIQPSLTALYGNLNSAYANGQLSPNQNTGQVLPWNQDMLNAWGQNVSTNNDALAMARGIASGNFTDTGQIGAQTLSNFSQGNFGGNAGTAQLANTASGAYLDPNNPAIKGLYEAQAQPVTQSFTQSTLPALLSTYAANGRMGSGANDTAINAASTALAQQLNNLSQSTIGQNYTNERANQMAASNQLASLGQSSAGLLSNIQGSALSAEPGFANNSLTGESQYQNYLQSMLNSNIAQSNFNNTQPLTAIQNLAGLLQNGMALSGSTSQTSNASNPLSSILGGGLLGGTIGAGTSIGSGWGAGIGALGGGLLSFL